MIEGFVIVTAMFSSKALLWPRNETKVVHLQCHSHAMASENEQAIEPGPSRTGDLTSRTRRGQRNKLQVGGHVVIVPM